MKRRRTHPQMDPYNHPDTLKKFEMVRQVFFDNITPEEFAKACQEVDGVIAFTVELNGVTITGKFQRKIFDLLTDDFNTYAYKYAAWEYASKLVPICRY